MTSLPPPPQSQAAINNPKNPTPRFKLAARSERPVSGISKSGHNPLIRTILGQPEYSKLSHLK